MLLVKLRGEEKSIRRRGLSWSSSNRRGGEGGGGGKLYDAWRKKEEVGEDH